MSKLSNTKLYTLRYLSYWLYVILTIGIPVGLIAWQYQLFTHKPGGLQLTAWGIITVIVLFFICQGHMKRAIAEMETSITKTIIQNVFRLIPWLAFWIILTFLEDHVIRIRFILFWSIIGNIAAGILDLWHTGLLKECKERSK